MPVPATPGEARRSHLESVFWRRALVWGITNVPPRLQDASMPLWSAFFYAQVPHIRRAIRLNLGLILGLRSPALHAAAFRTFTNYCRCVAHGYRLHVGGHLDLPVEISGMDRLRGLLSEGRGVILATGHLGNWQVGPYLLAEHRLPPVTVVMTEEPDPGSQRIDAGLRDQRQRVVYVGQSPLLSLDLRAALRRGELVGMQMDRPPRARGIRVRCAGGEARFSVGPAQLAWSSGAPILPVFFPLDGAGVRILVEEPLWPRCDGEREAAVAELSGGLASVYGSVLRRYPEQLFNFYDFWGEDPRGEDRR